jgi:hypothetical protein
MDSSQEAVEATGKLVEILARLESEQRHRAVSAAFVLLGEPDGQTNNRANQQASDAPDGISPKALGWAKKNSVSTEQLEHVFVVETGGVDVIAARAPGKSKRLQTIESYVLCGLRSFLATGESAFTDEDARAVCKKLGAYDGANHFNYVKGLGNLVTGSKEAGWRLTNPGLARGAQIVKQIVPTNGD